MPQRIVVGGIDVYVACSTLCFARLSLEEALRSIRDMHFSKVDLAIHADGPHVTPAEVAADVGKMATRLKASNLSFAAIYLGAYDDGMDHFKSICRLARLLAVPTVTVTPLENDVETASKRLRPMSKVASAEGVVLCSETHSRGVTGDPAQAVALCDRVPGMGLTLDPSYYTGMNWDDVYPFVSHVRLRDSGKKPEEFQVRVGQGDIDYGRIISHLEREGYDKALTVDIRDVPDSPFPVDAESRKLKYLLESLV
ncbi:MAG: TIM barrel protein [Gemmataceae bacterium]